MCARFFLQAGRPATVISERHTDDPCMGKILFQSELSLSVFCGEFRPSEIRQVISCNSFFGTFRFFSLLFASFRVPLLLDTFGAKTGCIVASSAQARTSCRRIEMKYAQQRTDRPARRDSATNDGSSLPCTSCGGLHHACRVLGYTTSAATSLAKFR
jgi:hypothetical protein